MGNQTCIKKCAVATIFLFSWFCFAPGLARGVGEDQLAEAKKLIKAGAYEEAARLLAVYIEKIRGIAKQKSKVAEAQYLLAKMYFEVGEDQKCDDNLRAAFQYDPELGKDEANTGLRARMHTIRAEVAPQVAEKLKKEEERRALKRARPKKKFPWLIAAGAVVAVVVVLLLTKKKHCTLTVTWSAGVDGTPEAGTTTCDKGTQIDYKYWLLGGYKDLAVKINGTAAADSGTLVMNRNTKLEVTASAMSLSTTLEVSGKDHCVYLTGSPAAYVFIPTAYHGNCNLQASGKAYSSSGHVFHNVFVFYFNEFVDAFPTEGTTTFYWYWGGEFYSFFADTETLDDNSGKVTLEFNPPSTQKLDVDGKSNCFLVEATSAARISIPPGNYQIKVSGNVYYENEAKQFKKVLVCFKGNDGDIYLRALEFDSSTNISIGGGMFYAFFAFPYLGHILNGKATLEFFK